MRYSVKDEVGVQKMYALRDLLSDPLLIIDWLICQQQVIQLEVIIHNNVYFVRLLKGGLDVSIDHFKASDDIIVIQWLQTVDLSETTEVDALSLVIRFAVEFNSNVLRL